MRLTRRRTGAIRGVPCKAELIETVSSGLQ